MNRCSTMLCRLLAAWALATAWSWAQETAPIPLHLVQEGLRDLVLQELATGETSLETRGSAPLVLTGAIPATYDPKRLCVLAFELLCPTGVEFVHVLYGPMVESHSARKRDLPGAETWVPVAIPLQTNWDKPYPVFGLVFGNRAGLSLRLRGLVLRAPADAETQAGQKPAEPTGADLEGAAAVRRYLGRDWPGRIDSVTYDRRYVRISGVAPEAGTSLVEIPVSAPLPSAATGISVTTLSTPGDFQVEIPRFVTARTGFARDRSGARWRLARAVDQRLEPLSGAVWAADADEAGSPPAPRVVPSSKKGMAGVSWVPDAIGDLIDLGCRNLSVQIMLPSILRLTPGAEATTPYTFHGKTYAVDEQALAPLDQILRFARQNRMLVSAVVLIPRRLNDPEAERVWCHPDACEPGLYAMANLTTPEGVDAYAAALDLLARRYGTNGTAAGRISNWIMHHEVDAGWFWTNAGEKSLEAYVELYYRALRTAHYAVRRHDPAGRVFVSLTHHWNEAEPKCYKPREILELLRDCCRREGDFEWGVAYHAYPQDVRDPRSWLDTKATFSFDTPLITMKNLEVLDAWMKQPDVRFNGNVRAVLLAEQGCNARDLSPEQQRLQAAGIAYFWHKVRDLDSIEAFHYQRWIDQPQDKGLLLGLRACAPGSLNAPGERKAAWEVFRDLGTAAEAGTAGFAKELIGVDDFSQVRYLEPIR